MSNPLAELRAIDPQQHLRQIRLDPSGSWFFVSDCTDDAWLYLHDPRTGRAFWRPWSTITWVEIQAAAKQFPYGYDAGVRGFEEQEKQGAVQRLLFRR